MGQLARSDRTIRVFTGKFNMFDYRYNYGSDCQNDCSKSLKLLIGAATVLSNMGLAVAAILFLLQFLIAESAAFNIPVPQKWNSTGMSELLPHNYRSADGDSTVSIFHGHTRQYGIVVALVLICAVLLILMIGALFYYNSVRHKKLEMQREAERSSVDDINSEFGDEYCTTSGGMSTRLPPEGLYNESADTEPNAQARQAVAF